jgi:hypothetical protein
VLDELTVQRWQRLYDGFVPERQLCPYHGHLQRQQRLHHEQLQRGDRLRLYTDRLQRQQRLHHEQLQRFHRLRLYAHELQ